MDQRCLYSGVLQMVSKLTFMDMIMCGNVPSHRLPGCGYVGLTMTVEPLRGCM